MPNIDLRALSVFKEQAGVMSRGQATALGFTTRQIDYRLGTQWEGVGRGVYRHRAFDHSLRAELFILTLSGAGYISHRHAARLHQLEPAIGSRPEVTTRASDGLRFRGLVIHESKQIATAGLTGIDGLPVSGVARTIMDVAAVETSQWQLLALIDSARRKKLTTPEELHQCLQTHARRGRDGTVRFRRALEVVRADEPPAIGHLSRQVAEMLHKSGLPYPRFEEQFYSKDGRFIAQVDTSWPCRYVQFYDGFSYHASVRRQTNRDKEQRQQLRQDGIVVDEFTYDQINKDPGFVIRASHFGYNHAMDLRRKAS